MSTVTIEAVVGVVNSGSCRDPHLMQLLRSLFFITAHFEIAIRAVHIAGRNNPAADAISRNKIALFFALVLGASRIANTPPASSL